MELSILTQQKKKTAFSLHSSPLKLKQIQTQEQLQCRPISLNKPNFLYFTQRQRQKINFFDTQSMLNNNITSCQKQIDIKISTSFYKTYKLKSKHLEFQNQSFNTDNDRFTSQQRIKKSKIKTRSKLRKKAYQYKQQQPCVGMYNPKPENFMKRIAKNQVFRRGKSCHNIILKNQNHQKFTINNSQSQSHKFRNQKQKNLHKDQTKKKISQNVSKEKRKQCNIKKINTSFLSSQTKIKSFDMSKQTPRQPFQVISNKIEKIDHDNNYIEKNYKKQIYIPVPMNGQELSCFYEKQRKKYGIQSSCGIFKHIKLKDFIKIHRNEVASYDQNNFD